MGLLKLVISIIVIGLIAFIIFDFAVQFASDNNSAMSIDQDPSINTSFTSIKTNLQGIQSSTNAQLENLHNDHPIIGIFNIVLASVNGIWKSAIIAPLAIIKAIGGIIQTNIFADNSDSTFSIVFSVLLGIFALLIVFGVLKLVTGAQYD